MAAETELRDRLNLRHEERLQEMEKRKKEKEITQDPKENATFFMENFDNEKRIIEEKIECSNSLDKTLLSEHFDYITRCIQKLQKFLSDSSMFLPSYDVKRSQDKVNELQLKATETQNLLMPKKKFGFKTRKKASSTQVTADKRPEMEPPTKGTDVEQVETQCTSQLGFSDQQDVVLRMIDIEVTGKDVFLNRLSRCTVIVSGPPLALHVNNLTDCTVLCGPVSSAILIENCANCRFVLACQQLRVHRTFSSEFYIHVTSRAIIEDCNGVGFAPFNWKYSGLEDHFNISGLSTSENHWSEVNDFNWLRTDEHSPNWYELPSDKQTINWE